MEFKHRKNLVQIGCFGYYSPSSKEASCGPLAQLVEQLAFNQLVERSSRSRPTIYTKKGEPSGSPFFMSVGF